MSSTRRAARRPVRTNSRRQHWTGIAISSLFTLGALAALFVGVRAWSMPRVPDLALPAGQTRELPRSPWFDSGSTVFAALPEMVEAQIPPAETWRCVLTDPERRLDLTGAPDLNDIGTRVIEGTSMVPVVTVGPTVAGSRVTCSGRAARSTPQMWVSRTDTGAPRVPLAIIIGGIALLGIAGIVHPRSRGITPFGR